jgi:glutamate formiminotransferase
MAVIECVPNISEGRRLDVVESLAAAARAVRDVRVLDYSADWSHHRSVFTLAGNTAALHEAVLRLVAIAVASIDLRLHRGEHPRLGAVDVVPFVPLVDVTMAECVSLARRVGRAIGEQFAVPVYLYEEAASAPARRRLEDVRRGGFEGLAARMADPRWRPDFGPNVPHPAAGATIVGARPVLVAYNVNLATTNVAVAQRIAAAIRERAGGLPCVKALGLRVEARPLTQVSMNLTNYQRTPMDVVFDRIVAEAGKDGVEVVESEVIGLVPAAAFGRRTPAELRLRDFSNRRILENCLRDAGYEFSTLNS